MDILKFKTNIKCTGCLAKVTPGLNGAVGEENWELDLQSTDKVLTVTPEEGVDDQTIIKAILEAGYAAEKLD